MEMVRLESRFTNSILKLKFYNNLPLLAEYNINVYSLNKTQLLRFISDIESNQFVYSYNITRDIVFIIESDILKISLFNSNVYIKLNESLRLNFKNLKQLIKTFPKE